MATLSFQNLNWPARVRAAGIHFCISLAIATLAAFLVFLVWYPYPYREISSGRELFLIVVTVDVILGPLITLAIFNLKKSRRELSMDFGVVGLVQLCALLYGLMTVFMARPVHLVFEIDRFRVVHLIEIPQELEDKAGVKGYPFWGPTALGMRPFKDNAEQMDMTMTALGGTQLSMNPLMWQPYEKSRADVLKESKPLAVLSKRFPNDAALIAKAVAESGRSPEQLRTLPMIGRKSFWTVFIDAKTAEVLSFAPIDSF